MHVPADVREICRELDLRGAVAAAGADLVTGFHHVVWMGDLNYRLDYGQQVGGCLCVLVGCSVGWSLHATSPWLAALIACLSDTC
jgi:hypothetical protein